VAFTVSRQVHLLRVVLASPGDVTTERNSVETVAGEVNRTTAADRGLRLEVARWETDAHPGFHIAGPQAICDAVLRIEDADLLIGIFWTRFGTPTADGRTGTEHEIEKALASWRERGRPQIMLFFSNKPPALRTSAERRYPGVHHASAVSCKSGQRALGAQAAVFSYPVRKQNTGRVSSQQFPLSRAESWGRLA
jgi:hypothetical protein